MTIRRIAGRALTASMFVVVAAIFPDKSRAQVTVGGGSSTINTTSAGYLGILQLKCDCTLRVDAEERYRFFTFRTDPVIGSIEAGSPAATVLRKGDYIVRIDGLALQSAEGARRFANIQPGQRVNLTISRDGRTSTVSLAAASLDWSDRRILGTLAPELPMRHPGEALPPRVWVGETPGAPPTAPVAPSPPARPGVAGAWSFVVPDSPASPDGWFGFSFRCTNCGWSRSGDHGDSPVWESGASNPELSMIAPGGPAARAGLQVGDQLTHIDGHAIARPEGARRLGAVEPGDRVRLTVLRERRALNRMLTLGRRPESRAAAAVAGARSVAGARGVATAPRRTRAAIAARELRYTGKIEDVSIEVWSTAGSTVERVGDTMVITVGSTIIRLKADPNK